MTVTFDPVNKWILLPNVTSITAQSIYNDAMDWMDENESMGYDIPLESTGFAPLGGGAYSDKIFVLINGWKIKPYSGTYSLTIIGTIITDDESDRTVPPDSGSVQIIFQVTSQGIVSVIATGSGVTEQDKQDIADLVETQTGVPIKSTLATNLDIAVSTIADLVWSHSTGVTLSERVNLIRKIEEGRWKIVNNQLVIYDDNGITVLKTFNLKDVDGNPSQTNVFERVPVP